MCFFISVGYRTWQAGYLVIERPHIRPNMQLSIYKRRQEIFKNWKTQISNCYQLFLTENIRVNEKCNFRVQIFAIGKENTGSGYSEYQA